MNINWRKIEEATLILIAFFMPLSIAITNIALGLGVVLLIRRLIVDRSARQEISGGITLFLLIYLGLDLLATLVSGYEIHLVDFVEDKWVVLGYFVALVLCRRNVVLDRVVSAIIISGSVMAAYAIFQFITGYDYLRGQPLEPFGSGYIAVGVFTHHLTYGGIALIVTILALWRIISVNPLKGKHLAKLMIVLLNCIGLFVSYARSAIVGLGAGLVVFIAIADRRLRKYAAIAAIIGLVLMVVIVPGLPQRFLNSIQGGEHSEGPRVRLWLTSLRIIEDNPFFGVGQSNFGNVFEQYKIPGEYHNWAHSHNDMLSVAVDGGLIALSAFLLLWVVFIIKAIKIIRSQKSDNRTKWMPKAGLTIVVSILVAGMFQNYLTDAEVANLVWLSVGLTFAAGKCENA